MAKICLVAILMLLFVSVYVVPALDWLGLDAGIFVLVNTDEDSAPSPLLNTLGMSIPFLYYNTPLYWEASLLFFNTQYQYSFETSAADAAGRPAFTPAEIEKANSLWVLGVLLDTRFGYMFELSDRIRLGGAGGLALVFRLPLIAFDDGAQYQPDAFAYFFTRFLYPEVELAFHWDILDDLGLSFTLRGLFPIFHIWDGENVSFADQLLIMGNLCVRIRLGVEPEGGPESIPEEITEGVPASES